MSLAVHGDDFTALSTDEHLDWYESELKKSFEIKIRGRLGEGCSGPQEIRILNRIVAVDDSGLRYEADPRHGDLLMSSLDLTSKSSAATPGVKPVDCDANTSKSDEPELPSLMDYSNPDSVINAILSGSYESSHKAPVGTLLDTHWASDTHGLSASSDTHWACVQRSSARPGPAQDTHGLNASCHQFMSILKKPCQHVKPLVHASRSPEDSWIVEGHYRIWIRSHSSLRRGLATPM